MFAPAEHCGAVFGHAYVELQIARGFRAQIHYNVYAAAPVRLERNRSIERRSFRPPLARHFGKPAGGQPGKLHAFRRRAALLAFVNALSANSALYGRGEFESFNGAFALLKFRFYRNSFRVRHFGRG